MNSFVLIRTKISEKNCIQVGISTGDHYRACNRGGRNMGNGFGGCKSGDGVGNNSGNGGAGNGG
jgi:hypothetical protein